MIYLLGLGGGIEKRGGGGGGGEGVRVLGSGGQGVE
jgi:hypothetical protein